MSDRYESPFRRGGLHHLVSHPDANDPRVAMARGGDPSAFVSILGDHDGDARTFVWSVLGDGWLMDDVLDVAYAEAFRSSASFAGQTSLRTWLHRHCWSACTVASARATMDWYVDADGSSTPADVETAALRRAWAGLPIEQRAALALVTVGGFSYDDAAEVCATRPATVSSWAAWGWDGLRSRVPGVDLRDALRRDVPGHREGFWVDLRSTLDRAVVTGARDPAVGSAPAASLLEAGEPTRATPAYAGVGAVPRQPGPVADHAVTDATGPATGPVPPLGGPIPGDPSRTDPTSRQPVARVRDRSRRGRGDGIAGALSWRWVVPLAAGVAVVGSVVTSLALRAGGDGPDEVAPVAAEADGAAASDTGASSGDAGEAQSPASPSSAAGGPALEAVDSAAVVPLIEGTGGYAIPGTPRPQAHSWTDANGTNVLVLSVSEGDTPGTETLHMTLASERDGEVVVQRTLVDPGTQPCDTGFSNDFLADSVRVSDVDADGVGEVTIGWAFACGPSADPRTVKLTLLEGDDKYILRGTGYLDEASARAAGGPAPTFAPEPVPASWPTGAYDHTVGIFQALAY